MDALWETITIYSLQYNHFWFLLDYTVIPSPYPNKMEKVILFAICVTVLFGIVKGLEMKYIEKDFKSLKLIVRDFVIVFMSSFAVATMFIQYNTHLDDFFSVITNTKVINPDKTQIFTGMPDFWETDGWYIPFVEMTYPMDSYMCSQWRKYQLQPT